MDAAEQNLATTQVKDAVGDRCQKLFQDFLEEWVFDNICDPLRSLNWAFKFVRILSYSWTENF